MAFSIATFVLSCATFFTVSLADEICVLTKFEDVQNAVESCTELTIRDLEVPEGKTLELQLQNGTRVTFEGTILFGAGIEWSGPLIRISGNGISVTGAEGSVLDGQGTAYWDGLGGSGPTTKPHVMRIQNTRDAHFTNIRMKNCPQRCVTIKNSKSVILDGWIIDNKDGDVYMEPFGQWGHNTDGFDVLDSEYITITNSEVYNQDDCVAVSRGAHMNFTNLFCHGSHGLSISASFSFEEADYKAVEDVLFFNCTVVGGENAIHVKIPVASGPGTVRNVTYRNINFSENTKYGIHIQEDYESSEHIPNDNVVIENLTFEGITGSVNSNATGVRIFCAENGCLNWNWSDVNVTGTKNCNFIPDNYVC